jgi:hypothetical protein
LELTSKNGIKVLPSGNLLHSYGTWPIEIVDLPNLIKDGDFPVRVKFPEGIKGFNRSMVFVKITHQHWYKTGINSGFSRRNSWDLT